MHATHQGSCGRKDQEEKNPPPEGGITINCCAIGNTGIFMDKIVNDFVIVIKSTNRQDFVLEFSDKFSFTYPDNIETVSEKEEYMRQMAQTISRASGIKEVSLYHRYLENQQLNWLVTYNRAQL